jgi:hypothetical protein
MIPFLLIFAVLDAAPRSQDAPAASSATVASAQAESNGAADSETTGLPVSIERVQRALSRPPAIKMGGASVFRVEVLGRKMSIEDLLGPDYLKGPVPGAGMTHQEFLDMVTPKDYQGYAPFTNGEAFTVAATSFLQKWALQKAVHMYETAHGEREREAARKEVQAALIELQKARARAGLPPD